MQKVPLIAHSVAKILTPQLSGRFLWLPQSPLLWLIKEMPSSHLPGHWVCVLALPLTGCVQVSSSLWPRFLPQDNGVRVPFQKFLVRIGHPDTHRASGTVPVGMSTRLGY